MAGTSSLEEIFRDIDSRLNEVHGDIIDRLNVLLNYLQLISGSHQTEDIDILLPFYYFAKLNHDNKCSPLGNVILPWCRKTAEDEIKNKNDPYSLPVMYLNTEKKIFGIGHRELYKSISEWCTGNSISLPWPGKRNTSQKIKKIINIKNKNESLMDNIPFRIRSANAVFNYKINCDNNIALIIGLIVHLERTTGKNIYKLIEYHLFRNNGLKKFKADVNCIKCKSKEKENNCSNLKKTLCRLWQDVAEYAVADHKEPDILFVFRDLRPPQIQHRARFEWFPKLKEHYIRQIGNIKNIERNLNTWIEGYNDENKRNILCESKNNLFKEKNKYKIINKSFDVLEKYTVPLKMALSNSAMDYNSNELILNWSVERRVKEIPIHIGDIDQVNPKDEYPADYLIAEKIIYPETLSKGALFIPLKAPVGDINDEYDRPSFCLVIIGGNKASINVIKTLHIINSYARTIHDSIIEEAVKNVMEIKRTTTTKEEKNNLENDIEVQIMRILSLSSTINKGSSSKDVPEWQKAIGIKVNCEPQPLDTHKNYASLIKRISPNISINVFDWINTETNNWFTNREFPKHTVSDNKNIYDEYEEDYKNKIKTKFTWLKELIDENNTIKIDNLHEDLKTICGVSTCWYKNAKSRHPITLGSILLLLCAVIKNKFPDDSGVHAKISKWTKKYYDNYSSDSYCPIQSTEIAEANIKILINMFNLMVKHKYNNTLTIKDITISGSNLKINYIEEFKKLESSIKNKISNVIITNSADYENLSNNIIAWMYVSQFNMEGNRPCGTLIVTNWSIDFKVI